MQGTALTTGKIFGLFVTSLFVLLVYTSYQVRDPRTGRNFLWTVIFAIISPIHSILTAGGKRIGRTASNYFYLIITRQDNISLEKQLTELKIQHAVDLEEKRE